MTNLLDTNIVSQSIKPRPDEQVERWLAQRPQTETCLSVISILEIRNGIEQMPDGIKRHNLERWFEHVVRKGFAGRILPVTEEIADMAGKLLAKGKKESAIPEVNDALIAATAIVHGLQLATLNRKHFEPLGVTLVDF